VEGSGGEAVAVCAAVRELEAGGGVRARKHVDNGERGVGKGDVAFQRCSVPSDPANRAAMSHKSVYQQAYAGCFACWSASTQRTRLEVVIRRRLYGVMRISRRHKEFATGALDRECQVPSSSRAHRQQNESQAGMLMIQWHAMVCNGENAGERVRP